MWGSSFADLAKKAQELQAQASNLTAGEIFNLDAIQSVPEKREQQHASQTSAPMTAAPPAVQPSFQLPSLGQATTPAVTPTVAKPPVQKGKLKMNLSPNQPKSGPTKGKAGLKTGLVTKLSTSEGKLANDSLFNSKDEDTAAPVKEKQELVLPPTKPGVESEANTDQNGTEGDLLPPMISGDNDKFATSEQTKPAEGPSLENDQQKSEETAQMRNDQGAVSPEDDDKVANAPAEESDKTTATEAESPIADDDNKTENIEEQKTKMEKVEKGAQGSDTIKDVAIENEPDPPVDATNQGDEAGTQSVATTELENNVDGIVNQGPEPAVPTDETEEAKPEPQESPVPEDSPGPSPEEETGDSSQGKIEPSRDDTAAVPTQPEVEISKDEKPTFAQPVVDNDQKPAPVGASLPVPPADAGADAERVMQQFTSQLQRIEANFEAERKEMRQQHQTNIQHAIASKEQEMEQLLAKMKERDLKIRELKRTKEGNELRMDSLKREVEGIKQLLEQRDNEIEELKKTREQDRKQLENQVRAVEAQHGKTQKELKRMQDELKNSKGELGTTHDEYTTLKSRVKVVANELKDRRVECRDLKTKIDELELSNEKLEDHVSTLESQLSDRDRSGNEKDEQVGGLRSIIEQLQQQLQEADNNAKAKEEEFEKNLGSYKKKAQNSLAVANSRAAAAVQSKEEAELEARAARSTADSTMERARVAEESGRKAMADAKEYYKEMEKAKTKAVNDLQSSEEELAQCKKTVTELQEKLELSASEKGILAAEKAQMARDAETERTTSTNLQRELTGAKHRLGVLEGDITELRSQLQIAEAAATSAKQTQKSNHATPKEDSTTKATIMMLQTQLKEANETIEELSEALQNAIALSEKSEGGSAGAVSDGGARNMSAATNGNDSVPLFYAMEKQAELNTARNEINRLSSLYADVQSEKAEAQEALDATKKALDEERSKLQRYEKLGSVSSSGVEVSAPSVNGAGNDDADSGGRTNIEYLKNIMLSFLNAKTITEKKALVPVIGAVLCLTPAEQTRAIQNVESTGGLEGFGSAFFETIGSKVGRSS